MPALAPSIGDVPSARLHSIGRRIRAHREKLQVSATDAAEASGMSRVTWHRIERGEPSVAMAAYMNAIAALGLELDIVDPQDPLSGRFAAGERPRLPSSRLPATIHLADYPQLQRLAWQLHGVEELTPTHALSLYERNWRHLEPSAMDACERALVEALAAELAGGRLLV